jgi:hypothetical protein
MADATAAHSTPARPWIKATLLLEGKKIRHAPRAGRASDRS